VTSSTLTATIEAQVLLLPSEASAKSFGNTGATLTTADGKLCEL
jgi:hypothetical protein